MSELKLRNRLRIAWVDSGTENEKRVVIEEQQGETWVDVSKDFMVKTKDGTELYIFSIAHLTEVEADKNLSFLHMHVYEPKIAFHEVSMIKKHSYLINAIEGMKKDGITYFAIEPVTRKSSETGAYIYNIRRITGKAAEKLDAYPHTTRPKEIATISDPDEFEDAF